LAPAGTNLVAIVSYVGFAPFDRGLVVAGAVVLIGDIVLLDPFVAGFMA
jgi:hypothetical protein